VAKILKSDKPEEKGNIKENAPRNLSGSYIKYTFLNGFLKGFTISAGHSQAGMRSTLDTNLKLPGYCILNTGIQYTKRHFNIAMNINNVANKTYWSAAYNNINKWPGAPRNYIIRVGYNF
jgi:iron complex outermembrane receptor protein